MFKGQGLLALWNGVMPERAAEYDLWHTREHVPERVGIPGMLSARRYVGGDGPLPSYLTLYDLDDTDVLVSPPYRALLEQPTDWTLSMRPAFRGFFRLACRPLARLGAGTGGALLATTLDRPAGVSLDPSEADLWLRDALAIPAVTSAQIAATAPEIPAVPFAIGGALSDYPQDFVLTLEGYDLTALIEAERSIEAWRRLSRFASSRTVWTKYLLGYEIAHDDLHHVVVAQRPATT